MFCWQTGILWFDLTLKCWLHRDTERLDVCWISRHLEHTQEPICWGLRPREMGGHLYIFYPLWWSFPTLNIHQFIYVIVALERRAQTSAYYHLLVNCKMLANSWLSTRPEDMMYIDIDFIVFIVYCFYLLFLLFIVYCFFSFSLVIVLVHVSVFDCDGCLASNRKPSLPTGMNKVTWPEPDLTWCVVLI